MCYNYCQSLVFTFDLISHMSKSGKKDMSK